MNGNTCAPVKVFAGVPTPIEAYHKSTPSDIKGTLPVSRFVVFELDDMLNGWACPILASYAANPRRYFLNSSINDTTDRK
jgi:hypothetical protein